MPRYDVKPIQDKTKGNIKGNINNVGKFNSKELTKDNKEVLSTINISNEFNDVGTDKVPSLKLFREEIENLKKNGVVGGGSGSGSGSQGEGHYHNEYQSIYSSYSNILNTLEKEKSEILAKANILIDAEITPELLGDISRTELIQSVTNYNDVYIKIKQCVEDIVNGNYANIKDIEDLYKEIYAEYHFAIEKVSYNTQNAITRLAQITAGNALEEANKHTDNIANQIVYKLEIHSSNGSSFKKGTIDTVLSAIVYKGMDIVTEDFFPVRYRWTRTSHDSEKDDRWNSSARRDYSIKITNDDVIGGRCTFNCELLDEEGNVLASAY